MTAYTDNLVELRKDKQRIKRYKDIHYPNAEDFQINKIIDARRIGRANSNVTKNY